MDALQRRLTRALGPTVDARMVAGDASAGIVRLAQAIRADLIVLGVSRRGAIAHRLRSATAARVMRAVACPILAVPERRLEKQRPEHGPAASVPERRDRLRPAA